MIDSVFISDLHLRPGENHIEQHFIAFIEWALKSVKNVYILGDFFHAWPGDDAMDDWSHKIALELRRLVDKKMGLFYIHGNRDFLLGHRFAQLAGWTVLKDPSIIALGQQKVLLAHGDKYCTKDKSHQWFRMLTRNELFPRVFQLLPLKYRLKLVNKVRNYSQSNNKPSSQLDVVFSEIAKELTNFSTELLIHGHTHKPGLHIYDINGAEYKRYVLSDWDDIPQLLCYDRTKGLYFLQINDLER